MGERVREGMRRERGRGEGKRQEGERERERERKRERERRGEGVGVGAVPTWPELRKNSKGVIMLKEIRGSCMDAGVWPSKT